MCLILLNHLKVLLFLVAFYFHHPKKWRLKADGAVVTCKDLSTKVLKNGQVAIPKWVVYGIVTNQLNGNINGNINWNINDINWNINENYHYITTCSLLIPILAMGQ